jgi:DNA-directed RNA polymerase subunit alpha
MPSLKDVEALINDQKYEEAEAQLAAVPAKEHDPAELAYCRGLILERTGRWPEAIEAYEEALQANDQHVEATFHLAYLLDLHGEDERALELYQHCVADSPTHVNALMNLAVMHEDAGRYDEAAQCLELILDEHPNHTRARLFLKDVESSKTMYYDEDEERVREKRNAVLDIPVSDFELSVRARNCLKQMSINTLGDLLRITEPELMAYKNFGETSLNEIKAMLTQKGLRLGQMLEEEAAETLTPPVPSLGDSGVFAWAVSELELSVRARKCLQRLNISTVGELAARTEAELLAIKNFGQTSLNEIKRRLAEVGVSLRSANS